MPKSSARMSTASIPYLMAGRNLGINRNMTRSVRLAKPELSAKMITVCRRATVGRRTAVARPFIGSLFCAGAARPASRVAPVSLLVRSLLSERANWRICQRGRLRAASFLLRTKPSHLASAPGFLHRCAPRSDGPIPAPPPRHREWSHGDPSARRCRDCGWR